MTEPTTEAGRDFVQSLRDFEGAYVWGHDYEVGEDAVVSAVCRIEREARMDEFISHKCTPLRPARAAGIDTEAIARSLRKRYPQLRVSVPELMMGLDIAIADARLAAKKERPRQDPSGPWLPGRHSRGTHPLSDLDAEKEQP